MSLEANLGLKSESHPIGVFMARNHYDFTNQRAIVTGGAQGIGRAIVDRLVAGSAKVTIWDMDSRRSKY